MTNPDDAADKALIEQAASEYQDADFRQNPDGYTVATYCNEETTSTAFEAGVAWRDSNLNPKVLKLVEALKQIAHKKDMCIFGTMGLEHTPERAFRQGSSFSYIECAELASEAIAAFDGADEGEGL